MHGHMNVKFVVVWSGLVGLKIKDYYCTEFPSSNVELYCSACETYTKKHNDNRSDARFRFSIWVCISLKCNKEKTCGPNIMLLTDVWQSVRQTASWDRAIQLTDVPLLHAFSGGRKRKSFCRESFFKSFVTKNRRN